MLVLFETAAGYALFKVRVERVSCVPVRFALPHTYRTCVTDVLDAVHACHKRTHWSLPLWLSTQLQMKKGVKPVEEDMHALFATPELAQDAIKLKVIDGKSPHPPISVHNHTFACLPSSLSLAVFIPSLCSRLC